jgi:hypothetical protein
MELLITPERVAEMAFRSPDMILPDAVDEAVILAAQQKFVRPVLGEGLYGAVCRGKYPALVNDFLASPLALYVKTLMLPRLAVQVGGAGVAQVHSKNLAKADEVRHRAACRRLRGDAAALMRRAVEHIEAPGASYPEYDPAENILNRISTGGGVVLDKTEYGKRR